MNNLIYVSAPYRAKTNLGIKYNIKRAKKYAKYALSLGLFPIVPHINSRELFGLTATDKQVMPYDLKLLSVCDTIWLCGDRITAGMQMEWDFAKEKGIEIIRIELE